MYKMNLPSYGFYLRHIKDIEIDGSVLRTDQDEPRYDIVAEDVHDLTIRNFRLHHPKRRRPQIKQLATSDSELP